MSSDVCVSDFLITFNSHALFTRWNDAVFAGHFYDGLPDCIKNAFVYIQCPNTFKGTRDFALEFDQQYWDLQAKKKNYPKAMSKSTQLDRKAEESSKTTQNPSAPTVPTTQRSAPNSANKASTATTFTPS